MSSIVYVKLKTEVRVNERCSGPTFGRQREITESRRTEHRGPPDRQARAHRMVITRWWKPDSFSPSQQGFEIQSRLPPWLGANEQRPKPLLQDLEVITPTQHTVCYYQSPPS